MNQVKSKTKYDHVLVKKVIEDYRGGLLVEQLYEVLPVESKPNRKYFVEFLRGISGVYVCKYDERMNRYFVTTLHGTSFSKRKLLVMIAGWEMIYRKKAYWYKNIFNLSEIYLELIKGCKESTRLNKKIIGAINLIEAMQVVSSYIGYQKNIFNKRHKKIVDGINEMVKYQDNDLNYMEKESKCINESCYWVNPYKLVDGWDEYEVKELYISYFLENNLQYKFAKIGSLNELLSDNQEKYHLSFLQCKLNEFNNRNYEPHIWKNNEVKITLINLYRKRIFLEIIQGNQKEIKGLLFHVFDFDDNLTIQKVYKITLEIARFIAQHQLNYPFKIRVYTWNTKKAQLYTFRFRFDSNSIPKMMYEQDNKIGNYLKILFKGFDFQSLNLDRYLECKGKYYWTKPYNLNLVKSSKDINSINK